MRVRLVQKIFVKSYVFFTSEGRDTNKWRTTLATCKLVTFVLEIIVLLKTVAILGCLFHRGQE